MSFSGNIEDVSVADTLQFIHLGGRSGTLRLLSGDHRAEIGFHHGRIVKALGPGSKRLGELLVESNTIEPAVLEKALQMQEEQHLHQSLGQVLVTIGAVDADTIYRVLERQIQGTVRDLLTWTQGTFEFALDEVLPMDDMAVNPGDVVRLNVDTQMVLLDALRLFDERNRDAGAQGAGLPFSPPASSGTPTAVPKLEAKRPAADGADRGVGVRPGPAPLSRAAETPTGPTRLQVVTSDPRLVEKLAQALKPGEANVVRVTLRDAGTPPPGERAPLVLLDFRQGGVALDALAGLRRARPRATAIAVIDSSTPAASVYEAGAVAAVEGKPSLIAACFRSVVQNRRDLGGTGLRPDRIKENYARLRRIVGDLRSGLISTTISLSLMNIISESVERAVLFLVRPTELSVLGAFGSGRDGEPLAVLTRGLRLPLQQKSSLTDSLDGQLRSVAFDEAHFPDAFRSMLGKPRSGQCAVFPVLGGQKVIATIYADNGYSNTAIEQLEILELAAVQAGLALENELLRRQVGQGKVDGKSDAKAEPQR